MLDTKYRILTRLARNQAVLAGDIVGALQDILPVLSETLDTDRVNFWQFEAGSNNLTCLGAYDRIKKEYTAEPAGVELPMLYLAYLLKERMIMIEDVYASEYVEELIPAYFEPNNIGAVLDTLIMAGNEPFGILCCEHVGNSRSWASDEQLFISAVANFIAIGLETQKLQVIRRELKHKEATLRSVVENTDSMIWLLDSNLQMVAFNKAFADMAKKYYNSTIYEGMHIRELTEDPEELRRWLTRYQHALAGYTAKYNDKIRFNDKDFDWEISQFPIVENGIITGISNYARDVSRQMRTRERLQRQNNDLQKINQELDEFVYRTSHDLRAPLTSVMGLIDLLENEGNPDLQQNYLKLMKRSVGKLDESIREILHLSSNTRSAIDVDTIELKSLLEETWRDFSFIDGAEKINFTIEEAAHTPFRSDRKRLGIIFGNLLSNAIRYHNLTQDSPFVHVSIKPHPTEENIICIEVSDNGQGISTEYLNRIFEMFFRANTQRTGSGLGLYIVRETLQKLHGTISVASELGKGTTFSLTLPALKLEPEQLQQAVVEQ